VVTLLETADHGRLVFGRGGVDDDDFQTFGDGLGQQVVRHSSMKASEA
jgi:hypothetical protein